MGRVVVRFELILKIWHPLRYNLINKEVFRGYVMKLKRIRDLREDNDLTQAEIAKYLNVTQRTYSRYENDDRAIPLEQLVKLADYYSTSVDYLLNRTDKKDPY